MYYIGVDLGGTNIAVGLLDKDFKIIAKEKCPTRTEREISEIMDDMGELCNTLIKNNFTILEIKESTASKEAIDLVEKYKYQKDRPYFLFIKAQKNN